MKLGYAQTDITPALERPVYLAGFGQNRRATGVHDPLYARALALQQGDTSLVLCALDLIGFFQDAVQQVTGRVQVEFPDVQLIIASTHTHHGPDTMGLWGPDDRRRGVDERYYAALKDQVVVTILDSLQRLQPVAHFKTGAIQAPGLAKNARDPEIRDEELTCLQFLDEHSNPMATVVDFPCHPEVLWEHNPIITSDYPGVLRQQIEAVTGAPAVFFSGALGGMMTPDVQEHSFAEAEAMGRALAQVALDCLANAPSQRAGEIELAVRRSWFEVRLSNILFQVAIRRGLLPDPRQQKGLFKGPVRSQVNLVCIGGCWLVTVPGELLPKLGLQIKAQLRAGGAPVTGIIGLANDELGYILPPEDFRYPLNPLAPGEHYEETMSISKQIGPRMMAAVAALLAD
ncbi:MAG: neutral/alkaline non-lysosomal ceramidase N-terminal domain-containing protein [Anaerolineales bacterium]|nr:neutral/alkaline non-lysosomal ceramidase N-terminal domain-containing protein [Anaerolineales bacterium]